MYAYRIEYKTMMMTLLSLLSSLVSLHRAYAMLLTVTCSHSPVESFWHWGHGCASSESSSPVKTDVETMTNG